MNAPPRELTAVQEQVQVVRNNDTVAGSPPRELMAAQEPTMVSSRVMVGGPRSTQGPSSARVMWAPIRTSSSQSS